MSRRRSSPSSPNLRDPAAQRNNVKLLKGYDDVFRLRVGDWRVLFSEDDSTVTVSKIASRGSAYDS